MDYLCCYNGDEFRKQLIYNALGWGMKTPEQRAREKIDDLLEAAGWVVQSRNELNLGAGLGVAVREFQTTSGPADYVLFVNRKAVGVWGYAFS